MYLLDINLDCLCEILGYIEIIDLIRYRSVSKYMHTVVGIYIKNNKKKCDTQAYYCDYLFTPEYLVVKEDENTSHYTKVISHLYKYSSTIRLFLYDENGYPYRLNIINKNAKLDQNIMDIYMPKLRYVFADSININPVFTPRLKYNVNLANNNNIYYLDTKVGKIYDHVENIIFNSDISLAENIKYFPNCKKLYIYFGDTGSDNIIELNIKEIYTTGGMRGEIYTKIFPNLMVLYIDLTMNYDVNNICLRKTNKNSGEMRDKNAITIYTKNNIGSNTVEKIIIMEYMVLPDLLQLFPKLKKIYIVQDNFNFKLGHIQIIGINYMDEIKKLVFS